MGRQRFKRLETPGDALTLRVWRCAQSRCSALFRRALFPPAMNFAAPLFAPSFLGTSQTDLYCGTDPATRVPLRIGPRESEITIWRHGYGESANLVCGCRLRRSLDTNRIRDQLAWAVQIAGAGAECCADSTNSLG